MDQIVNATTSIVNATVGTAAWTLKPVLKLVEKGVSGGSQQSQQIVLRETIYSLPPNMRKWIAISGLMGASAVAIGAYGVSSHLLALPSCILSARLVTNKELPSKPQGPRCVSQKRDCR